MLVATLRFDPEEEEATGDGWALSLGQDSEVPVTTTYATITLAQAAALAAFQADTDVDGYFTQAAEAAVLVTEAATVASTKAGLLTAEGL